MRNDSSRTVGNWQDRASETDWHCEPQSISLFTKDSEFIDFLKKVVIYCSSGDEEFEDLDPRSRLYKNLKHIKSLHKRYKKDQKLQTEKVKTQSSGPEIPR